MAKRAMERLNRPMAYINALAEEGTKEDVLHFLIKAENELGELREELQALKDRYG